MAVPDPFAYAREQLLTPDQRRAEQELALQRYLDRLDHQQWRDPATGRIISRRQRQVQVASTKWWSKDR